MLGIDAGTAEMRSKAGLELGKIVELRRVDLVGDITNDSVSSQRLSPRCPTTLFQILSRSVQTQAVTGQFARQQWPLARRSEEHTSELQSLMRISYAVLCLKKKKNLK